MKFCSRCRWTKPFQDFSKRTKSLDGYQAWCKECMKEKNHAWELKNKIACQERSRSVYKEKRVWLNTFKQVPCMDCNQRFPSYVMDFDHRENKLWDLSRMVRFSQEKILAEIAKCDIVCSNCHRIRTYANP